MIRTKDTKNHYEVAKKNGYSHLVCVPASIQFVLPIDQNVPGSIYEEAKDNTGLFPYEILGRLKSKNVLTYSSHSIAKEEMDSNFANKIKVALLNSELLGVGLSFKLKDDHFHFVTIKGPIINNDVQVFDTSHNPTSYKVDIDKILSRAINASEFGRHNVYLLYPTQKKSIKSLFAGKGK